MGEGSCQTHVGSDEIHNVSARQVWDTNSVELGMVDLEFVVQDS